MTQNVTLHLVLQWNFTLMPQMFLYISIADIQYNKANFSSHIVQDLKITNYVHYKSIFTSKTNIFFRTKGCAL